MPNRPNSVVENNFTKGFVTEFTGLNFPENAATDCDNTSFSIIGDISRRFGINQEVNGTTLAVPKTNSAIAEYQWINAGGDGNTQLIVNQVGNFLYFYNASTATISSPISTKLLASTVNFLSYQITGSVATVADSECTFADGNGYLFVFHPDCEPFYCTYSAGVVTANSITLKIRDFTGVLDGLEYNTRPVSLSNQHQYNLVNQGWSAGSPWTANSSATTVSVGSNAFTVQAGLVGVTGGQAVSGTASNGSSFSGTVTSYAGTTLTINVTTAVPPPLPSPPASFVISPTNVGYLATWFAAAGNYPSNADVWWYFKNASGVFDPATRIGNVTLAAGKAPGGHFIIQAFNQNKNTASGLTGLTSVSTVKRPNNGCWFQGRIWYTGVNAQQAASGDAPFYTWSSDIYFSQVVQSTQDFGNCFQVNDPTSEELFGILPTDGGVIRIPEAGSIYKLFSIQNGLLVFAANGIWFITGSQGIGFAANDYTVTQISKIRCISGTSFVNVNGLPYFWNEEGVYAVQPADKSGLEVDSITVSTILSFYGEIPLSSKKYARGAYDPVEYQIQWIYRDTEATDISGRYTFNKILCYNTYNKAFYPWTVTTTPKAINGIIYVTSPGGLNTPPPLIKYLAGGTNEIFFADEHDEEYVDWGSEDFLSYFVTGYKIRGQAQRRFQVPYIYMFSNSEEPNSYRIQGIWDYASSGSSGRWSTIQRVNNWTPRFGIAIRRHRIRGQGLVFQIKVSSTSGEPFSLIGWSAFETVNSNP